MKTLFKGLAVAGLFIFSKAKEVHGSLTAVCSGVEKNN